MRRVTRPLLGGVPTTPRSLATACSCSVRKIILNVHILAARHYTIYIMLYNSTRPEVYMHVSVIALLFFRSISHSAVALSAPIFLRRFDGVDGGCKRSVCRKASGRTRFGMNFVNDSLLASSEPAVFTTCAARQKTLNNVRCAAVGAKRTKRKHATERI